MSDKNNIPETKSADKPRAPGNRTRPEMTMRHPQDDEMRYAFGVTKKDE